MRTICLFALALLAGIFAATGAPGAAAAGGPEMRAFRALPVMDGGRIKPLESFARARLREFSGRTRDVRGRGPAEWLALSLFDPARAAAEPVFAIPDPTLRAQLRLEEGSRFYSLEALGPGLDSTLEQARALSARARDTLRPDEEALLALHEKAAEYAQLLRSFSAVLPLEAGLPESYSAAGGTGEGAGARSFLDLAPMEKKLERDLQAIIAEKGRDPAAYDARELAIAKAAFQIEALRAGGASNTVFRVLPGRWDGGRTWLSPWEALLGGQGSPETAALAGRWKALADSYRTGDAQGWAAAVAALGAETMAQAGGTADPARLEAEVFYRVFNPYAWITGLYALGFLCAGALAAKGGGEPGRRAFRFLRAGAVFAGGAGVLLHVAAIAARIYILDRPPVGTLYESVLFVSLICAAPGVLAAMKKTVSPLAAAGFLSAAGLLLIAPVALPQGDSLEVLAAVLNTNFWLATHVVCITIGYGVCILAAGLGHALLFAQGRGSGEEACAALQKKTRLASLAALFFMALGTVLGGIWADQSWGRFWGWDPKENGALLIVLWLVWVQHGRISGHMGRAGFAALMALLNIVVALSWFGVNLLNVGLHSYGFTSGMAGGLAAFCAVQGALVAALYIRARVGAERKNPS